MDNWPDPGVGVCKASLCWAGGVSSSDEVSDGGGGAVVGADWESVVSELADVLLWSSVSSGALFPSMLKIDRGRL